MTTTHDTPGFPRADDGKGWAWGLMGDKPEQVWERFSPAYEAQAAEVLAAMARLFGGAGLDYAGDQDGEAALAFGPSGRTLMLLHLEEPQTAKAIAAARADGQLDAWLLQARADDLAEAVHYGYTPDAEDNLVALPPATPRDYDDEDEGLTFPREDDGLGWAWGLTGDKPTEIWERFSPGYEAQAEAVLEEISAQGWLAVLDWAGEQDGEAAIGLDDQDNIVVLFHLEDPAEAQLIAQAIKDGRLPALVKEAAEA